MLNVYFWGENVYFRGKKLTLEIRFTLLLPRNPLFQEKWAYGALSGVGGHPKESFEAIFCLKNYFYFLRLFLKTLQKYPLKQA